MQWLEGQLGFELEIWGWEPQISLSEAASRKPLFGLTWDFLKPSPKQKIPKIILPLKSPWVIFQTHCTKVMLAGALWSNLQLKVDVPQGAEQGSHCFPYLRLETSRKEGLQGQRPVPA